MLPIKPMRTVQQICQAATEREGLKYTTKIIIGALIARIYWEFWRADENFWWNIDGYPTLVAAHLWLSGKQLSVYHPDLWIKGLGNPDWRQMLVTLTILPSSTSFVYHPLYLWCVAPFIGWMDNVQFSSLWVAVNAMSTGIVAAETSLLTGQKTWKQQIPPILLTAISFPALYANNLGQNTALAMALIIFGARMAGNGRAVVASILMLLAVTMKAWLLPLTLFIGLLSGKKGAAILSAILFGGLYLLPHALDNGLIQLYEKIVAGLTNVNILAYNNISLRAEISRALDSRWIMESHQWSPRVTPHEIQQLERLILTFLAICFATLIWRMQPKKNSLLAAACALSLLIPGVCWTHYLLLAIPLAAMLSASESKWRKVSGGVLGLFLVTPWHSLHGATEKWPSPLFVAEHPTLVFVLLATPLVLILFSSLALITDVECRCAPPFRPFSTSNSRQST